MPPVVALCDTVSSSFLRYPATLLPLSTCAPHQHYYSPAVPNKLPIYRRNRGVSIKRKPFHLNSSPTFGLNTDTGRLATVLVVSLFFTVDATEGETRGAVLPLPALVEARVATLPVLACDAESEKSPDASNPDPNNAFHLFTTPNCDMHIDVEEAEPEVSRMLHSHSCGSSINRYFTGVHNRRIPCRL